MAENMIKFLRGNVANLPQTATPGALYFTKDEGVYLGLDNGSYHRYGDFITVADVNSLPSTGAHETCMYYCTQENILARYDSAKGWIQINKQPTAEEMKTLLGLGGLAYKSVVAEADLDTALKEKVNAAAEGNHSHANKAELDKIVEGDKAKWDAAVAQADANKDAIATIKDDENIDSFADVVVELAKKQDIIPANTYDVYGAASAVEGKLNEYKTSNDARVKALEDVDNATQVELDKAVEALEAADLAINNKIGVVAEGKTVVGLIGEAQTTANNAQTAVDTLEGYVGTFTAVNGETTVVGYVDAKVQAAVESAKQYADANDANTTYGIEYDSTNKKIKLVESGTTMEIDATAFIKDGMVSSVAIEEIESVKNLVITFNTDAGKEAIKVPLTELVDIYTGVNGEEINVIVSSDNKISAELKNGTITKERLAESVQASLGKADTALQAHQDISHLATETDLTKAEERIAVLEKIDHEAYVAADTALKAELQGKIDAIDNHSHANKALLDTYTQTEENLADAVAKKHAHTNAAELDKIAEGDVAKWNAAEQNAKGYADGLKTELQAEIDADVKVVNDALETYKTTNNEEVAKKANSADVYAKTETYTKSEIEALLTWEEFN